ncbi:hypothetical protein ACTHGU_08295 [Chitinophagaceae bacterium MMS25-I14]
MQPHKMNNNIQQIELRMEAPYVRNRKKGLFSSIFRNSSLYFVMITVSRTGGQLTGRIGVRSFNECGRNEYIPFSEALYNWRHHARKGEPMPDDLYFMCTVLRCRGKRQDEHTLLKRIQADGSYLKAVQRLMAVIPETVSYPYAVHMGMQIADAAGKCISRHREQIAEMACHMPVAEHLVFQPGIIPITCGTKMVDFNMELLLSSGRKMIVSEEGILHEIVIEDAPVCMRPM